jgi:hypothetical protein
MVYWAKKEDFGKYLEICRRYKDQYEFKLNHWVLMNNPKNSLDQFVSI